MELNKSDKQQRAENYAIFLLSRQDYTESKLRDKIKQNHPEADPEKIIVRMMEFDYVNDERFAERYVQSMLQSQQGVAKIKQKMYAKGFPRELIDSVSSMDSVQEHDFKSSALSLKIRLYGEDPISDQKLKQKAINKLLRQGFAFDAARYAVETRQDDVF
jgi:regulatory protein